MPGLLALQTLPRVGPATALKIAREEVALTDPVQQELLEHAYVEEVAKLEIAAERGVTAIAIFDARYPQRLASIPDPPPVLFARGNRELLWDSRMIAVVGTREPSVFGESAASAFTEAAVRANWIVVSGLALGIDTVAHVTALKAGGRTIAVLGNGLDRVYPQANRTLAEAIVEEGGLLLSELPFGAEPIPRNLIARDRLQSGLSVAVLVVQTAIKGGTMHTARFATEQGRSIFCPVPQGDNPKNEGIQLLLSATVREAVDAIPAWRDSTQLRKRTDASPVAKPVDRKNLAATIRSLDDLEGSPARPSQQAFF